MKAIPVAVLLVDFFALAASAGIASAVSFDLNYGDPASDVVKFWATNDTPVLTPTGNLTLSPFPDSVNLLWIRSANASANVDLTIQVKGGIANLANTSYEIRLFTRSDNASHFSVTYATGTTTLRSNATGFTPVDLTGTTTITSTGSNPALKNTLVVSVQKTLLAPITAWNIDAIATQTGSVYTYHDYGWEQPGNPGSTPAPSPTPSRLPSWIWLAILPVILAIVAVIVMSARRKKPAPPPQS